MDPQRFGVDAMRIVVDATAILPTSIEHPPRVSPHKAPYVTALAALKCH
jgi:hypothetical protein